jgi:hypothetical protein
MNALEFVEVPEFTRDLQRVADEESLRALQLELLRHPAKGDLIQGTGGLRKVRMKLPGRGKSGGARVIYLHLARVEKVILLFIYTKARQSDLTPDQRRRLRLLAEQIEQAYAPQHKDRHCIRRGRTHPPT